MFIEGLSEKFANSTLAGLKLSTTEIHHLLYADDLVILAHSKEALHDKITLASN
jgi:hypothetical protein